MQWRHYSTDAICLLPKLVWSCRTETGLSYGGVSDFLACSSPEIMTLKLWLKIHVCIQVQALSAQSLLAIQLCPSPLSHTLTRNTWIAVHHQTFQPVHVRTLVTPCSLPRVFHQEIWTDWPDLSKSNPLIWTSKHYIFQCWTLWASNVHNQPLRYTII